MPTMEQIKDGYFNYLVNEMLQALYNADDYKCKDFDLVKLDMIINLNRILRSREDYNNIIKILKKYDKVK